MRYIYTFIILVIAAATVSAQQLTAKELISKITCKDKACYNAMVTGKGYVEMPGYGSVARIVNYTQKTKDCGDNHAMFSVENWPNKGLGFKLTTVCVDTYDKLLGEFTAEGFVVDMKTTTTPQPGEVIKTAKYTSPKHIGMTLYAGKGDKGGKTFCLVRLMAD